MLSLFTLLVSTVFTALLSSALPSPQDAIITITRTETRLHTIEACPATDSVFPVLSADPHAVITAPTAAGGSPSLDSDGTTPASMVQYVDGIHSTTSSTVSFAIAHVPSGSAGPFYTNSTLVRDERSTALLHTLKSTAITASLPLVPPTNTGMSGNALSSSTFGSSLPSMSRISPSNTSIIRHSSTLSTVSFASPIFTTIISKSQTPPSSSIIFKPSSSFVIQELSSSVSAQFASSSSMSSSSLSFNSTTSTTAVESTSSSSSYTSSSTVSRSPYSSSTTALASSTTSAQPLAQPSATLITRTTAITTTTISAQTLITPTTTIATTCTVGTITPVIYYPTTCINTVFSISSTAFYSSLCSSSFSGGTTIRAYINPGVYLQNNYCLTYCNELNSLGVAASSCDAINIRTIGGEFEECYIVNGPFTLVPATLAIDNAIAVYTTNPCVVTQTADMVVTIEQAVTVVYESTITEMVTPVLTNVSAESTV